MIPGRHLRKQQGEQKASTTKIAQKTFKKSMNESEKKITPRKMSKEKNTMLDQEKIAIKNIDPPQKFPLDHEEKIT